MAVTPATPVKARRNYGDSSYSLDKLMREQLSKNRRGVMDVDLPNITTATTVNVDITGVTDAIAGALVQVFPPALTHGLVVQGATIPTAGTIRIRVSNFHSADINEAAGVWGYQIFAAVPVDLL